jgi:hypothetical protein
MRPWRIRSRTSRSRDVSPACRAQASEGSRSVKSSTIACARPTRCQYWRTTTTAETPIRTASVAWNAATGPSSQSTQWDDRRPARAAASKRWWSDENTSNRHRATPPRLSKRKGPRDACSAVMTSQAASAASVTAAAVSIAMMYTFTSYLRPRTDASASRAGSSPAPLPPHGRPKRWPVRRITGHPVGIHSPFCTDTVSSVVHRRVRCPRPGG